MLEGGYQDQPGGMWSIFRNNDILHVLPHEQHHVIISIETLKKDCGGKCVYSV